MSHSKPIAASKRPHTSLSVATGTDTPRATRRSTSADLLTEEEAALSHEDKFREQYSRVSALSLSLSGAETGWDGRCCVCGFIRHP